MNAPLQLQTDNTACDGPTGHRIRYRTTRGSTKISYYLSTPKSWSEGLRVLVSVHGISFNAAEHAMHFSRLCQQLGLVLVAPVFAAADFPRYQRLGLSTHQPGPRADLALDAVLEDVTRLTGADTTRFHLFGYSGGGQFAHRYAMLHPRRVIRAVLGAPGWYTFPDRTTAYPRGLRWTRQPPVTGLDAQHYLRVPMAVFVGEHDCYRDPALNRSARIDRQQGYTRVDRGQRWISAMRRAARASGLDTEYRFGLLQHCGHSFLDSMVKGHLGHQALNFLLHNQPPPASRPPARNWTVFAS